MFTANAAGLKQKCDSLKSELKHLNIGIFSLQETHYKKKGTLSIEGWEIFEAIRREDFCGTMIGVQKALDPVLIVEYSGDFELLVVEANIANKNVRIISGYGPQECWSVEERLPFFQALEEEITKAGLAGKSVMISLDANSKLGKEWIPADSHNQSPNGKVLSGILKRHALCVVNSLQGKSKGLITRRRTTVDGDEKSTIDFVILSDDLVEDVESVRTDEEQANCLAKFRKTKGGVKVTKSDHNSIITKFNVEWSQRIKKHKIKLFNLKNIEGQKKFKLLTSKPGILSDIFKDETRDIES